MRRADCLSYMTDLHVVILAAGKGTRMKSALPKVLHPLAGRPIISHVLHTAQALEAASTTLVVGHGADAVRAALLDEWPDLHFAVQSPQLGTGHALLQTESFLQVQRGTVVLLYGDVPLLQTATIARLLARHAETHAIATVLTAELDNPHGYGRIVRDVAGRIERIVEERDASPEERAVREVNSGIYVFELEPLFRSLHALPTDNAQGEYYLTDLVAMYTERGLVVETLRLDSGAELRGVNSRVDLSELSSVVRARKAHALMLDGVTLEDASSTFVDQDVRVGADTVIGPGVTLSGKTVVGTDCRIHRGVRLTDASIGDGVTVLDHSIVIGSSVADGAAIGPFAHIRPGSTIGEGAHVGNFTELKKTTLGRRSKANHLAYLGDAMIGEGVNIGAGTITCNYDGLRKHQTTIEDGVFIGSDSQLVAPVTVGKGAYVAAGSTITQNVPADALAIGRGRQENKPGWASAQRALRAGEKH
jgi:bifunctional UDP-N-acetylglucosamine pyrophosphorylase/glucosamine-1-phosphate N-acetyltransferase